MALRLLTEFYNGGNKPNEANDRKMECHEKIP